MDHPDRCPYVVGAVLNLEVERPAGNATLPETLQVKVRHVYPFSNACVMRITVEDGPRDMILKIYDSRWTPIVRQNLGLTAPWTSASVDQFTEFIDSIHGRPFLNEFIRTLDRLSKNFDAANIRDELFDNPPPEFLHDSDSYEERVEAFSYLETYKLLCYEHNLYSRLAHLQGGIIPQFICRVRTRPWRAGTMQRLTQYSGFVREFIDGDMLCDALQNASVKEVPLLTSNALQAFVTLTLACCGICLISPSLTNIIVRAEEPSRANGPKTPQDRNSLSVVIVDLDCYDFLGSRATFFLTSLEQYHLHHDESKLFAEIRHCLRANKEWIGDVEADIYACEIGIHRYFQSKPDKLRWSVLMAEIWDGPEILDLNEAFGMTRSLTSELKKCSVGNRNPRWCSEVLRQFCAKYDLDEVRVLREWERREQLMVHILRKWDKVFHPVYSPEIVLPDPFQGPWRTRNILLMKRNDSTTSRVL